MVRDWLTSHAGFHAGQGVSAVFKSARRPRQISVGDGTGRGVTGPGVGVQGLLQVSLSGLIQTRIRDVKSAQPLTERGHILVQGAPHRGDLTGAHASRMSNSQQHHDGDDGQQNKQDDQGRNPSTRGRLASARRRSRRLLIHPGDEGFQHGVGTTAGLGLKGSVGDCGHGALGRCCPEGVAGNKGVDAAAAHGIAQILQQGIRAAGVGRCGLGEDGDVDRDTGVGDLGPQVVGLPWAEGIFGSRVVVDRVLAQC